jgi:exoenzyme U
MRLDRSNDKTSPAYPGTSMQALQPAGLAPRPPRAGPLPRRQPHALAQQADRPLRISLHDDGQATLEQDLKLHRLVLTGGGAKGVAYPGALKALEHSGQLAHIREVGGTSVGAIVAALVATGMDGDGCKTLLDRIHLHRLFARKDKPAAEPGGSPPLSRLRSQLSIAANLGSTAPNLRRMVDQVTRENVLKRIAAEDSPSNPQVDGIRDKLARGGPLSLGDLHTLSGQVPGIKDFYCTSTAVYSGPGVQGQVRQLAVFSSTDEACRHMEIADAVFASAALPVIFKAEPQPLPHDLAGAPAATTRFIDGGLTLNTPIRELIDPDTPPAENLILYFEEPVITRARLGPAGAKPPSLAGRVIKTLPLARHSISRRKFLARELVHGPQADQAVEVKLKGVAGQADYSGSKGRLAIWMTQAEKDELQEHLYGRIVTHLEQRNGHKNFPSLYHLLFSLDDEALRLLRARGTPALREPLERIDGLRASLGRFMDTMNAWSDPQSRDAMIQEVIGWLATAEVRLGGSGPCREAFAQALASDRTPPVQRMFDLLRGGPAPANGQSLHAACLRQDEERATRRITQRIRSEFIYPSMDKPLQVSRNAAALRRADEALSLARTRAETNAALLQLESDYRVMGLKGLKALSPVVSKLRTYYLAPRS